MASRSTTVIVRNQSNAALVRTSWELAHGIWSNDQLPPEQIAAGTPAAPGTATWESESQGFATGTEGQAVYTFPDGNTTVTIYWDNPYSGSNAYRITFSGPGAGSYRGSYTGGDGDNATVTFTISAA
jgi:uncharacterized protein (DUF2147 family)